MSDNIARTDFRRGQMGDPSRIPTALYRRKWVSHTPVLPAAPSHGRIYERIDGQNKRAVQNLNFRTSAAKKPNRSNLRMFAKDVLAIEVNIYTHDYHLARTGLLGLPQKSSDSNAPSLNEMG